MKIVCGIIILLGAALHLQPVMAQEARRFNPAGGTAAVVVVKNQVIEVKTVRSWEEKNEAISLNVGADTSVHIEIKDYHFDGALDYSVWYWDEGKGTYTIHRIFLFSKKRATFKEYFPDCGDEFVNLKVDETRRRLISTYFKNNVATLCTTKPSRKIG